MLGADTRDPFEGKALGERAGKSPEATPSTSLSACVLRNCCAEASDTCVSFTVPLNGVLTGLDSSIGPPFPSSEIASSQSCSRM